MSTDTIHGLSLLLAVISLCGGAYLLAGVGVSLIVFGGLLLGGTIYSRRITDADDTD